MSYSADLKTANKEQALLCEERAREALAANEIDRAVRLTQKSLRLYRTERAEKLLQDIYSASLRKNKAASKPKEPEADLRKRRPANSQPEQTQQSSSSSSHIACTPEQQSEILRIKRTKDYYEILGVQRTATDSELKKTFRKLALRMHPDKCGHPEAAEVFKKITAAYQCLSDEHKRNIYDQTGHDDEQQRGSSRTAFRHDMFPEDIAEMFFNANMRRSRFHGGQRHYYRARAPRAQQGQTLIPPQLIQLLPLLLLFAFSWLNSPSHEEPFSLDRTGSYQISRTTKGNNIQYFVAPSFVRHYTRDARALYQVEEEVEQQYHSRLKTKCKREKDSKRKLERKARQAKDASRASILEKAYNMRMPACEKLDSLFVKS